MMIFKKYNLVLVILSSALLLSACEDEMFGLSESQFNQLSPSQKEQVISSYNKKEEIKQQNQPVEDLIDVLGSTVQQQKKHEDTEKKVTTTTEPMKCHMEGNKQTCSESSVTHEDTSSSESSFRFD